MKIPVLKIADFHSPWRRTAACLTSVLKIADFHSPWRRTAACLTSMKIGRECARILLLLALPPLLLAGCAAAGGEAVTFQAPPWHDGETSVYDVRGASGNLIGIATWTWQAHSEGWLQTNEVDLGDQVHRMVVLVDGELRRPELPLDNGQSLQSQPARVSPAPISANVAAAHRGRLVDPAALWCQLGHFRHGSPDLYRLADGTSAGQLGPGLTRRRPRCSFVATCLGGSDLGVDGRPI
jgi:hypothetical protein